MLTAITGDLGTVACALAGPCDRAALVATSRGARGVRAQAAVFFGVDAFERVHLGLSEGLGEHGRPAEVVVGGVDLLADLRERKMGVVDALDVRGATFPRAKPRARARALFDRRTLPSICAQPRAASSANVRKVPAIDAAGARRAGASRLAEQRRRA